MLFKYVLNFHQVFLVSDRFTHRFLVKRWGRVWFPIFTVWVALYDLLTFFVQLTSWATSLVWFGSHSFRSVFSHFKAQSRFLWALRFISFHNFDFLHWCIFIFINIDWNSSNFDFFHLPSSLGLFKLDWSELS